MDSQKPGRQRQLGVFHQRASNQRGLNAAAAELVELATAVRHKTVMRAGALRAAQPPRPTRASECLCGLLFGAEAAQKLRDRHAVPELDLIAGQLGLFINSRTQITGTVAHWTSLLRQIFSQVIR